MRVSRVLAVLIFCVTGTQAAAADYYGDIRPLIERKCVMCHSDGRAEFSDAARRWNAYSHSQTKPSTEASLMAATASQSPESNVPIATCGLGRNGETAS